MRRGGNILEEWSGGEEQSRNKRRVTWKERKIFFWKCRITEMTAIAEGICLECAPLLQVYRELGSTRSDLKDEGLN